MAVKKFSVLFIVVLITAGFNILTAQWEQVSNGIGDQRINALVISGNYMFAGTDANGVFVSSDNSATWTQTSLTGIRILCLAAAGNFLYAGTNAAHGVYYSQDNGVTWTQSSFNNQRISMLAVSGGAVYAAVGSDAATSGVYVSYDNGATFSRTSLHDYTVSVIADGTVLYAGTQTLSGDYLYRSFDQGLTWTSIYNRRIFSMYFGQGYMLAGYGGNSGGGISKSTDNGITWSTVTNSLHTYALAGNGNYIFAGGINSTGGESYGAYFSTDYGATWAERNEGFPDVMYFSVYDLKVTNNYVYAATGYGVWRNPNNYFTLFYDYGWYTGMNNWVTNQGWAFSWAIQNGAFTDSPGKNYSVKNYTNKANNYMALKNLINASNYVYVKLSFVHKYLTQEGKDFCRVEVSSNNGTTWSEAGNYSGTLNQMTADEIDITNLVNKSASMKIRFRLTSDSRIVNDGWYVTNIKITARTENGNITDNIITNETPKDYMLSQNYPNPFNPKTVINFRLLAGNFVTLKVYDISGREITTLVNGNFNPGLHRVEFEGSRLSTGVYFYKLTAGEFTETKRMILLK